MTHLSSRASSIKRGNELLGEHSIDENPLERYLQDKIEENVREGKNLKGEEEKTKYDKKKLSMSYEGMGSKNDRSKA